MHIYRRGGWSQSSPVKIFFSCSLVVVVDRFQFPESSAFLVPSQERPLKHLQILKPFLHVKPIARHLHHFAGTSSLTKAVSRTFEEPLLEGCCRMTPLACSLKLRADDPFVNPTQATIHCGMWPLSLGKAPIHNGSWPEKISALLRTKLKILI